MRKRQAAMPSTRGMVTLGGADLKRWAFLALTIGSMLSFGSRALGQATPSSDVRAKVLDQARHALVRVELYLKAVPEEEGSGGLGETNSSQALDQQQRQVIRFKKPIQLMGVVTSAREILVPDTGISLARIDRFEVTDGSGKTTTARLSSILRDAPTLALAPVGDVTWKPAEFANAPVQPNSSVTVVTPDWAPLDLRWLLRVSEVPPTTRWDGDAADQAPFWVVGSLSTGSVAVDPTTVGEAPAASPSLVFSSTGQLLGVGLADRIHSDRATPPWRAADLAAAVRVSVEDLEKTQQRLTEELNPTLYPVRIEFRRPKGGFQALQESEPLGWALTDRLILAPWELYRQVAGRIARIVVQSQGSEIEAELVGQLRDFSAILLRIPDSAPALPAHANLARSGKLVTYRPNLSFAIARKFGANDLRTQVTRSLGLEYGYKNRTSPRFTPAPYIGSLVVDLDGNPIGMFARTRRPFEELELIQSLSRQGGGATVSSVEFYEMSQLAEIAQNPNGAIDPRVVRREEKDQDRRAWLGVECSPFNKDLAESMGCRKESKDGSIGMMVSQIYPDSPAEKIGLRAGDVLMSLDVPQRDQPVYLSMPRGRGQGDPSQMLEGGGGPGGGRAPWPSQSNFLTGILSIIGEGTELNLAYWRDGNMQRANFQVEQGPPDQDSAAQFKDEQVGLTVKEVTFEVRAALRMKPNDPGVVVTKVESGTPAGRARINPFEIIQSADGEPIDSPDKFEAVLKRAQEQKKEQLRLTVVDRGRSRFADIKFTQ
jgi:S1-C subfamily serine protease